MLSIVIYIYITFIYLYIFTSLFLYIYKDIINLYIRLYYYMINLINVLYLYNLNVNISQAKASSNADLLYSHKKDNVIFTGVAFISNNRIAATTYDEDEIIVYERV